MNKLRTAVNDKGKKVYHFWCFGCDCFHGFNENWQLTGSLKNPTVNPSLVTRGSSYSDDICHLFIIDGKLQYLHDCTHEYKGQTIEMRNEE